MSLASTSHRRFDRGRAVIFVVEEGSIPESVALWSFVVGADDDNWLAVGDCFVLSRE